MLEKKKKITIQEARKIALETLNKAESDRRQERLGENTKSNIACYKPHYNKSIDYFTVFFSDAAYYEEYLEDLIIYRDIDTDEVVGVRVRGITEFLGGIF